MSDRGAQDDPDRELGDSSGFGFGLEPPVPKDSDSGATVSPEGAKAVVRALQQKEEKEEEENKSEDRSHEGITPP